MLKLSQEELDVLREALPEGGYKLVSDKLSRISPESVRKILSEPERYNSRVINATIEVLRELKEQLQIQRQTIKEVTS